MVRRTSTKQSCVTLDRTEYRELNHSRRRGVVWLWKWEDLDSKPNTAMMIFSHSTERATIMALVKLEKK